MHTFPKLAEVLLIVICDCQNWAIDGISNSQWKQINSKLLFAGHFQQLLLVERKQPPALLQGQIAGPPSLVELNGFGVVFRHDEVHAAAAGPHGRLAQNLQNLRADAITPKLLHDKEVLQVKQFSNPRVIGEIVHGKGDNSVPLGRLMFLWDLGNQTVVKWMFPKSVLK